MYGCFDAVLIYGFNEGNRDYSIDYDYLEEHYPNISKYAMDVVRNHIGEAAYGVECKLNFETGQVQPPTESTMNDIKELYDKVAEYYQSNLNKLSYIGYYLVVYGDYESQHQYYTLC